MNLIVNIFARGADVNRFIYVLGSYLNVPAFVAVMLRKRRNNNDV